MGNTQSVIALKRALKAAVTIIIIKMFFKNSVSAIRCMMSMWKISHTCLKKFHTETVEPSGWKVIFPEREIARAWESRCSSIGPTSTALKNHQRCSKMQTPRPHLKPLELESPEVELRRLKHTAESHTHSATQGLCTSSAISLHLACNLGPVAWSLQNLFPHW